MRTIVACMLVVGMCAACTSEGGSLSGSLNQIQRLDFDQVRARLYSSELAIEYVRSHGWVPVRVTVQTEDGQISSREYRLPDQGDVTGRLPDGSQLPRVVEGTVSFGSVGNRDGAEVAGDFDARFDAGGDTFGLSGTFDTSLRRVWLDPPP